MESANMIYITFSIQISVRVSPPQITGGGFHRFSISTTSDINTELSRPAENILHIWILMILQFLKVRGCCCFNISSLFWITDSECGVDKWTWTWSPWTTVYLQPRIPRHRSGESMLSLSWLRSFDELFAGIWTHFPMVISWYPDTRHHQTNTAVSPQPHHCHHNTSLQTVNNFYSDRWTEVISTFLEDTGSFWWYFRVPPCVDTCSVSSPCLRDKCGR